MDVSSNHRAAVVNGMVYVRGNRANYDSWAAEGCTGWDADTVNAFGCDDRNDPDLDNEFNVTLLSPATRPTTTTRPDSLGLTSLGVQLLMNNRQA